jgi:hypothetical protein
MNSNKKWKECQLEGFTVIIKNIFLIKKCFKRIAIFSSEIIYHSLNDEKNQKLQR